MFSKSCKYAIRATLFIAKKSQWEDRVNLNEIAAAIDSPIAYTAKILQILVKSHIVSSIKGPNGGFEIQKNLLSKLNLKQVVQAIDGDLLFDGCALGLPICNAKEPCTLHSQFVVIRNQLNESLISSSLMNVATDLNLGITVLKR